MSEKEDVHRRRKHMPQGIEYHHRAEPKEKKESRIGVRGTPQGMGESEGEGGPPV
jgi:hypothetical protein